MELISIFKTGGITLALTIVWALLTTWFMIQAVKAHNSGGTKQGPAPTYGQIEDNKKTPFHQIPQFWGAVIVTALYIICIIAVASDYKGVV